MPRVVFPLPAASPAEYRALYGNAAYADRSWAIGDFQGYRDGVLRVALFIQAPFAALFGQRVAKGDGRGFDALFSPNRTRAFLEIDFARDRAYVRVNPSCEPGGDCVDAKDIGNGLLRRLQQRGRAGRGARRHDPCEL